MGNVANLQKIKARREEEEKFFYVLGFVEGRFPQVDISELHKLILDARYIGRMDIHTLKEFTFLWETWEEYKGIVTNCINYNQEQQAK